MSDPPPSVIAKLAASYHRNGYVRQQNRDRVESCGWFGYKKGSELRLSASSKGELEELRDLLRQAGFKPGRPFAKGRLFRQPIYGQPAIDRFFDLISPPRRGLTKPTRSNSP